MVRRTGATPAALVEADRAGCWPCPPALLATGPATTVRPPPDYYVRVHGVDNSVDPAVIGRMVHVHTDLDTVAVTCAGRRVARHDRCWCPG